jgi:hypothetical protein
MVDPPNLVWQLLVVSKWKPILSIRIFENGSGITGVHESPFVKVCVQLHRSVCLACQAIVSSQ